MATQERVEFEEWVRNRTRDATHRSTHILHTAVVRRLTPSSDFVVGLEQDGDRHIFELSHEQAGKLRKDLDKLLATVPDQRERGSRVA